MSHTDNEERPKLDVYARLFVPQSLKNVNEAPANIVACSGARWIDFPLYVQTFAGNRFLAANTAPIQQNPEQDSSERTESSTANGQPQTVNSTSSGSLSEKCDVEPNTLEVHNYHAFFKVALKQEAIALQRECVDQALYRVPLNKASGTSDPRPSMYTLLVPGLRETTLRIEVGDIVQLRQLRFGKDGQVTHGSIIKDKDGNPVNLPRKNDTQHNSVVWGIDRLRETLSLRVDSLPPRSMLFNVQFTTQSGRLGAMYRAVIAAQHSLTAGSQHKDWMNLDLHDPLLNYEQQKAVNTVLNETYGPIPFIISGPPGTGKTKTIVELALQLVAKQNTAHLLVCAPSNPAADTLVQRMSNHLKPSELLRINAPSRTFPEVPSNILTYCHVDDGMFALPPFGELMRCKVVVTTCRDAEILVRARISNRDFCYFEQELHAAIYTGDSPVPKQLHWTSLLIDEAAQATEPEALIPLSVIAPPDEHEIPEQHLPIFVMAGDQHQLGPRTASKTSAMQTSLFERLLDKPMYRDHPLARSKQSGGVMRVLTQEMLPILRPPFANLIRNYRSHPAILATPSSLFYNDTLEPEATKTDSLLSWPYWNGRGWPVLFAHNGAPDDVEQDGGGWYNVGEAQMACRYAHSFIQTGLVQTREICIMSPFRAQVKVLRNIARAAPFSMSAVSIGPLEAFQGLESRLVILCTTRTRDRSIDQDIAKGLGVIHEPKRFNVALTRAKEGLIVIGNPDVLGKDENWRAFIDFCKRNGLCEPLKADNGPSDRRGDVGVSRLERRLVHRDERDHEGVGESVRKLGFVEDSEHSLWTSGVATEEFLRTEENREVDEAHAR